MEQFFSLSVVTEPDRQRFARFAIEAVEELGGSPFTAASRTSDLLGMLRTYCGRSDGLVTAGLGVADRSLCAFCGEHTMEISDLPREPEPERIERLGERLRSRSESTDPELLKRRNERITSELEQAKARAAAEMSELEEVLEHKKLELAESIRIAETDSLTGLLNRGAYDSRLRDAVRRCTRQHQPLSLILLDLDKFKEINDTHGHQYGDEYLRKMAGSMCQSVRADVDFPCRVGGDEFAIVVNAGADVAERIADKVLERMAGRVSAGVAGLRPEDDMDTLVARADAALYEAKEAGRGRVRVEAAAGLAPKAGGIADRDVPKGAPREGEVPECPESAVQMARGSG